MRCGMVFFRKAVAADWMRLEERRDLPSKTVSSAVFMVICDATLRRCAVKNEDEIAYLSSFQADQ